LDPDPNPDLDPDPKFPEKSDPDPKKNNFGSTTLGTVPINPQVSLEEMYAQRVADLVQF